MKAFRLALLCVVCVAGASAQQPKVPPAALKDATALFDELHGAYLRGDYSLIFIRLKTPQNWARIQPALEPSMKRLIRVWKREDAAFVLEMANAVMTHDRDEALSLLSVGRNYVINRPARPGVKPAPAPLGVNKDDDAFELIWHKIAVAILLREGGTISADVYLDTVERRYVTSPAAKAAHTTLDPRFLLMRGMVAELRLSLTPPPIPTSIILPPKATDASQQAAVTIENRTVGPQPEYGPYDPAGLAARAYEQAVASDAGGTVAPEANVRFAAMRFKAGRSAEALVAIDRAKVPAGDPTLAYWAALWRGRILDSLNRQADAVPAYQQALALAPTGQAAGVGLALSLFKQNRREEAVAAAARVQALPPTSTDPWWLYRDGDARFIAAWIDELRRTLQ